jgi:leucyl aminopeptidase
VVDIATLTGACVIALGAVRSGLFSAHDEIAAALQQAGESAMDPCWRMPLDDEYAEGLKSNFADMGNVAGRAGGSITAAKFLQKFTADLPWAHLDIAGTAWKSGAAKGSTGRPVPLLLQYLLDEAARPAPEASQEPKKKATKRARKA